MLFRSTPDPAGNPQATLVLPVENAFNPRSRGESVVYETAVGKFILSMSSDDGRPPILVLSFSSLEDMGEYLALEHPGLEGLVDDASRRAGPLLPGLAGNWAEEASRMSSHPAGRFGTPA